MARHKDSFYYLDKQLVFRMLALSPWADDGRLLDRSTGDGLNSIISHQGDFEFLCYDVHLHKMSEYFTSPLTPQSEKSFICHQSCRNCQIPRKKRLPLAYKPYFLRIPSVSKSRLSVSLISALATLLLED